MELQKELQDRESLGYKTFVTVELKYTCLTLREWFKRTMTYTKDKYVSVSIPLIFVYFGLCNWFVTQIFDFANTL